MNELHEHLIGDIGLSVEEAIVFEDYFIGPPVDVTWQTPYPDKDCDKLYERAYEKVEKALFEDAPYVYQKGREATFDEWLSDYFDGGYY